jgi:protein-tyrosine phosphatase
MIVDFHSHVLPGIDDGSKSVEESLSMLRMEMSQGIHHVVATPHFYARYDDPEKFLTRREEAVNKLLSAMEGEPLMPRLSVGAEVYYFQGISDCDILHQLTIDKKKYILVEMPHVPWTDRMYRELQDIHYKLGLIPIIAHVDRYMKPFQTFGIPERLAELPVLVQANADFFLRPMTRGLALRLLRDGAIHLLGSDCHNLTTRVPNLDRAMQIIQKRLGPEALAHIQACADEVLCGRDE